MTKKHVGFRSDFKLSPADKADARAALVLLADSGLTLTEAARRALIAGEAKGVALKRVPVHEAVQLFLADRLKRKRRGSTLEYYENQLARFISAPFAERWQRVTRAELKQWLEGLAPDLGYNARSMVFRCTRALYRWAAAQNPPLVASVPTEGLVIDDEGGEKATIQFYAVEQCAALLSHVSAAAYPALVVHLFAGVRPEEIAPRHPGKERLAWEHLDFDARHIRVPAEVAKTRRARLIEELPTPLWEWLAAVPVERRTGPIWESGAENWRWHMKEAHRKSVGVPWIRDGFRHTFATMMLALTKDAGRVGEWLGHEGKAGTLRNKYVGLERRANAERFLDMAPLPLPLRA